MQIQCLRDLLWIFHRREVPVRISSGCRCPSHNKAIGGMPNSLHLQGNAADVFFEHVPVLVAGRMVYLADKIGLMKIGGLGVYPDRNFLHLDIRPPGNNDKTILPVTWINENGYYRYGVDFSGEIDWIV